MSRLESLTPHTGGLPYEAELADKWFIVVDGNERKHYDGIGAGSPVFSPDSKRLAYAARVGGKWSVVVDGKEGKEHDDIVVGSLAFSPDSQFVAYIAKVGNKEVVVANGTEGKYYDAILGISGFRSARIVFDSPADFHYLAVNAGGVYLVEESLK